EAREVAGAVEPRPRLGREWMRHERRRRLLRVAPVAGTEPDPADVEVADLLRPAAAHRLVEDEDLLAAAGDPDRDRLGRVGGATDDAVVARGDGRLGRP